MVDSISKWVSAKPFTSIAVLAVALVAPVHAQIQFEETTGPAGIAYSGESWGLAWCDFDGDGRPDIFANNHRVEDTVWLNIAGGTFEDVGRDIDIDGTWRDEQTNDTHAATCADFDNDGDQDLVVSSGQNGNNQWGFGWRFFVNQGGLLDNQTAAKNLSVVSSTGGRFPGWIDADNNGRLDLMVLAQATNRDAHLYMQNSNGTFTNTTNSRQRCRANYFMLLSDLNVDGRMEMICFGQSDFPDKVYRTSTNPFTDITASVPYDINVQDTAIADFDNDLRPDIFHVRGGKRITGATQFDSNSLESQFIADGDFETGMSFVTTGVLTVAAGYETQTSTSRTNIGSGGYHPATFNFTLDPANPSNWGIEPHDPGSSSQRGMYIGYTPATNTWQFLTSPGNNWTYTNFRIDSTSAISALTVGPLRVLDRPAKPTLYFNKPGGFQAADLVVAGLNQEIACVSVVPGDFDNDGDVDLYVVCREAVKNIANRLYENLGGGRFALVAQAGGAEGVIGVEVADGAGTGESVVTADYDSNGFLDLLVANGLNERKPRVGGPMQLFRNQGNGNHWIQLDLQGVQSNRDGLGAKVFATTPNGLTQLREQNGGYHLFSQNHPRIHFGLANQTLVNLRVEWPSGRIDNFTNVAVDSIYRVTEQGAMTRLPIGPPPPPPAACGPPVYDKAVDSAIFLWKECSTGQWKMVMTAGPAGSFKASSGTVVATQPLSAVVGVSIESNDVFNVTATEIGYSLQVVGPSLDGFNFTPASDGSVCFGVGAPGGTQVLVGEGRLPVNTPFNLATLGPCS